jgi:ribosome biogenesis GTPase / thiamine phosphate phosphatase
LNIEQLGWNAHFERHFKPYQRQGFCAARVVRSGGGFFSLLNADGEQTATLTGQLRHTSSVDTLPAVGDWVVIGTPGGEEDNRIQAVLPRKTALKRAAAGNRKGGADKPGVPQVLAANVDTAIIVSGLDNDYNLRRIERFLTLVHESGATPIIILNKADLCPETALRRAEVEALAFGTPVLVTSALHGAGLEALASHLAAGRTLVLLGSSGAGKSTLLNRMAGSAQQRTAAVSAFESKGTHTTTHRELFPLPGGALVIDTPGLRELHLWGESEGGLEGTFPEILTIARQCRFSDCRHENEPGCAIRQALLDKKLDGARLESYLKQRSELAAAVRSKELSLQVAQKHKLKSSPRQMQRWQPAKESDQEHEDD